MLLNDKEIIRRCKNEAMIHPFFDELISAHYDSSASTTKKVISYGVSSYGYDIRLGSKFILDGEKVEHEKPFELEPHDFILAESLETFNIPRDILALCVGKSTYARQGIIVNLTPLEPEWKGILTIEISNTTKRPVTLYPFQGIAQLLFNKAPDKYICDVSYDDRCGKYQDQVGVTEAR